MSHWLPDLGQVSGPSGAVVEYSFDVTRDEVLEGMAWIRCPECRGNPRGFSLPDGSFQKCNLCKSRLVVPVMV